MNAYRKTHRLINTSPLHRSARRSAAAAIGLATCLATAQAQTTATADDEARGRFCSATTRALFDACGDKAGSDASNARALCINLGKPVDRQDCFARAADAAGQGRKLCTEQRAARRELCAGLGEARYEPTWNPADFDADFHHPSLPNPWFPLTIGSHWKFAGSGEVITVDVLDKTKLIDGVTCVVVHDRVKKEGKVAEDTVDWYGQRRNGTVDYCGESSGSYSVFEGDVPVEPELVDVHGSWKKGRAGSLAGAQFLGAPFVGAVYRQEFSPNTAEDAARVVSVDYRYGRDPVLDRNVPRGLAELMCAAGNCVVISEFTPLDPGAIGLKYYAPVIGQFLEVDPATGDTVRLIECNVDPRCAALPALSPK